MKKFILIGGPSRSATNTISMFLHLHDDVVVYGTAAGLHPKNEGMNFFDKLIGRTKGIQTCVRKDVKAREHLVAKKDLLQNDIGLIREKLVIALRWDYAESIFPLMLGIAHHHKRDLKMVVSLRNIADVFKSQYNQKEAFLYSKTEDAIKTFNTRIENSFIILRDLKQKVADKLLFVDITTSNAQYAYSAILDFIGIDYSELQDEWVRDLPTTNETDNWKDSIEYDVSHLEEMRLELLSMEGR